MKAFLKVLSAIFSVAMSVGVVIIVSNGFEGYINSFCENPFETIMVSICLGGIIFIFSFGRLNDLADYYCD